MSVVNQIKFLTDMVFDRDRFGLNDEHLHIHSNFLMSDVLNPTATFC